VKNSSLRSARRRSSRNHHEMDGPKRERQGPLFLEFPSVMTGRFYPNFHLALAIRRFAGNWSSISKISDAPTSFLPSSCSRTSERVEHRFEERRPWKAIWLTLTSQTQAPHPRQAWRERVAEPLATTLSTSVRKRHEWLWVPPSRTRPTDQW
jgi:hypothetical protein